MDEIIRKKKGSAYSEKALTGRRDSRDDGLPDRQALEDDWEKKKEQVRND